MTNHRSLIYLCIAASCLIVAGCNDLQAPAVDPGTAAASAIELYDKNSDGMLDATELESCPPLREFMFEYDLDGDKQVSSDELVERLEAMYGSGVALTTADCKVSYNGRPLVGATVRYVPDPFLGEATRVAEGVTDKMGFASIAMADEDLPEDQRGRMRMQVGLYRVEITHPTEEIPAKFNTETVLGFELHPYSHTGSSASYRLKSK